MRTLKLITIAAAFVLSACGNQTNETTNAPEAARVDEGIKEKRWQKGEYSDCTKYMEPMLAAYRQLLSEKQYWPASNEIRPCAEKLHDDNLRKMVSAAELESRLAGARNTAIHINFRAQEIIALKRDFPEEYAKHKTELSPIMATYEKEEAASRVRAEIQSREIRKKEQAEAARRKKEGVSLGMTPDEVISSSWGKPDRVNRTTNAYGTTEQWVYGYRNFLYFRNGRLETIQN